MKANSLTLMWLVVWTSSLGALGDRLLFSASPSILTPPLSKLLELRCAVEKGTISNAVRDESLTGQNQTALKKTPTVAVPPTTTASTTKKGTKKASQIIELLTTASSLSTTSLAPATTPQPAVDVAEITAITISKLNSSDGKYVPLANDLPCRPPKGCKGSSLDATVQIEGDTQASPISTEKGYIRMVWEYPSNKHAGTYLCQISVLDTIGQLFILQEKLEVSLRQPTFLELAKSIIDNHKGISSLTSDLETRLATIQNDTDTRLNSLKAQHIQMGTYDGCPGQDATVQFQKPYAVTPRVFLSVSSVDFGSSGGYSYSRSSDRYKVDVTTVTKTGFSLICRGTSIDEFTVSWMAIDA